MRSISVFAEDIGHEQVIGGLVERVAAERGVDVRVRMVSVRGGFGAVQKELKQFVDELLKYAEKLPDLVIVATDSNCRGFDKRRKELVDSVSSIVDSVVFAVPDPHVERWIMLDPAAFRSVLDHACDPPDQKCDRGRYKQLLIDAIVGAGQTPLLGGMEYAAEIIKAMRLPVRRPRNELEQFVAELRTRFNRWKAETDP